MKIITLITILCIFGPSVSKGQRVEFGLQGGGIATAPHPVLGSEGRRYTAGPNIEIKLFGNVSLEAGAMYKRVGFGGSFFFDANTLLPIRFRGHSFEFPLLGKYTFNRKVKSWKPFASAGYAFRATAWKGDTVSIRQDIVAPTKVSFVSHFDDAAVVGAGLRREIGRFKLVPEFRYTRWSRGALADVQPRNQAEVLLGIRF